jgi:hypothetical protein
MTRSRMCSTQPTACGTRARNQHKRLGTGTSPPFRAIAGDAISGDTARPIRDR